MSIEAIKTIRVHNWKMTRFEAKKLAQKFINLISARYLTGVETNNETYFVLPGFEHVTKNQPVVAYHPTEGWGLQTRDLFVISETENN